MKLQKSLWITSVLQGFYCLICLASTVCFGVCRFTDSREFFDLGNALMPLWMLNPIAVPCFIANLFFFLYEKENPEFHSRMGRKWIWVFLWPVITTFLWFLSVILLVAFTGGV